MIKLYKRLAFLICFSLLCCFGFAANTANSDTVIIKTNIYCNHCMQCESCKGRLVDMLLDEKGIKDVLLDVEKMTITVFYNAKKTNPQTIRKHIAGLGYDADDVKATAEAYGELDGCCKKE